MIGFIEHLRKAYDTIDNRGKKCACCGGTFLYYETSPEDLSGIRSSFGIGGTADKHVMEYRCPHCNASNNERAYALWMTRELPKDKSIKILDVAQSKTLQYFVQRMFPKAEYYAVDLYAPDSKLLMETSRLLENAFDFFIGFPMLERTRDDRRDIHELHGLMKRDGKGIIVVSLGANRAYDEEDFITRFEEAGFTVNRIPLDSFGDEARQNELRESTAMYMVSSR